MIKKTIEKLEASIHKMKAVDAKQKKEISRLLATLKSEVEALSKTHQKHAQNIETHLDNLSPEALAASVQGFEASHPQLVETINELSKMLARIGI